jgi:hypothetical protein
MSDEKYCLLSVDAVSEDYENDGEPASWEWNNQFRIFGDLVITDEEYEDDRKLMARFKGDLGSIMSLDDLMKKFSIYKDDSVIELRFIDSLEPIYAYIVE